MSLHEDVRAALQALNVQFEENVEKERPPSHMHPEGVRHTVNFVLTSPPLFILCEPEVNWTMPFYHKKLFLHGESIRARAHFLLLPIGMQKPTLHEYIHFMLRCFRQLPFDLAAALRELQNDVKGFLPSAEHNEPMYALPAFVFRLNRRLADTMTTQLTGYRIASSPESKPYAVAYKDGMFNGPVDVVERKVSE